MFVETIYVTKSRPCVVLNQTEQCLLKEQNLCDFQLFGELNVQLSTNHLLGILNCNAFDKNVFVFEEF